MEKLWFEMAALWRSSNTIVRSTRQSRSRSRSVELISVKQLLRYTAMTAESGKLIVTSSLGKSGETASPMVWDAVCESEADRDCIADRHDW